MREEWFFERVNTGHVGTGRDVKDYTITLGPQLAKGTDPYMSTLMRWLRTAIAENELSKAELGCILASSGEGTEGNNMEEILQQLTPSIFKACLYGSECNPASAARWDSMFEVFQDWLVRRAKYNETKRHVFLRRLQTERLGSLVLPSRHEDILREAE